MLRLSSHTDSIKSDKVKKVFEKSRKPGTKKIKAGNKSVDVQVPFPSPADWRDHWIYFLMVDRFNNPGDTPLHQWDMEYGGFQGGTINGVREKLDYLKKLGVGAIWLTPLFKNCQSQDGTYHGYGFQDLLTIDPRFGTEDDLKNLVLEAHAREIYVILDIVLNHAGDVFAYDVNGQIWNDAGWNDQKYKVYW
jgi:1,4-alpha-glucan branching enzyme